MTRMTAVMRSLGLVLFTGLASQVMAATPQDVDNSFNPYAKGFPSFNGLKPGVVIQKNNLDQFKAVLDPGLQQVIANGWYEIKVGPTTQFLINPKFVEASKTNLNKTTLGAEVGEIKDHLTGRPFVEEPDLKDPRAGEKLAWNFRAGAGIGDNAVIAPFYWRYRDLMSGKVERTVKFSFNFLKFKHRIYEPEPNITPNPADLSVAILGKVFDPPDLKNTQILILHADDDRKGQDGYMYLGFQRRVRRMAPGQYTDAFLGSDVMVEDFEGFNGKISDMKWTYKGAQNLMLPMFNHNEMALANDLPPETDGYKFLNVTGQGGCFPDITWQLRKTFIVEAEPLDPKHPISKRIFYLDAQSMHIVRTLVYDRKGELWKIGTLGKTHADAHLPQNKGVGMPIDDIFSAVDIQAKHCTTGQFKGYLDLKNNPPSLFQVQNLRSGD